MVERRRISPEDFKAKFLSGETTRLGVGFWVDADQHLHVSVPELLALVDLEDTEQNREIVAEMVEKMFRQQIPLAEIIRHDPK